MQELLNSGQLSCIRTVLGKLKVVGDERDMMISGFSGGRTTHSGELYFDEATAMIKHLKSIDPDEAKADVMRKKIISMAHELRWRKPGTKQVDMKRVDDWCKKYGYLHKKINQYTYKQLPALVTQFEAMYASEIGRF